MPSPIPLAGLAAGSGCVAWWRAVAGTCRADSGHMAEDERGALADFRRHASLRASRDLGVEFAVSEAGHARGVPLTGQDPRQLGAPPSGMTGRVGPVRPP